ncbi:hypothetical protein FRB93_012867 [Tulasnella sp. JGI-2019a]|nr:hypothetical protein FRB93_012867 [Tulasnella sp. JGI-2019a]
MCMEVIHRLSTRRHRSGVVLSFTIALLVTSTINIVLFIVYNYNGWIKFREFPGVIPYFLDQTCTIMATRNLFMVVASVTSDLLIIWRMYTIWGENWKITVLPILLLFTELVASIILCVMWFRHYAYVGPHQNAYITWEIIGYVCTVLVNGGCTAMVVVRIWWIGRRASNARTRSKYKTIVFALIESGAMYTLTLAVWAVFAIIPQYVGIFSFVTYIFTMVVSIAPMLIVLHISEPSHNTPSPALGDGVSTMSGSPNPDGGIRRPNHGVVSTNIRFVSFGRSTGSPATSRLTLPRTNDELQEKAGDDVEAIPVLQSSDVAHKSMSPAGTVSTCVKRASSANTLSNVGEEEEKQ